MCKNDDGFEYIWWKHQNQECSAICTQTSSQNLDCSVALSHGIAEEICFDFCQKYPRILFPKELYGTIILSGRHSLKHTSPYDTSIFISISCVRTWPYYPFIAVFPFFSSPLHSVAQCLLCIVSSTAYTEHNISSSVLRWSGLIDSLVCYIISVPFCLFSIFLLYVLLSFILVWVCSFCSFIRVKPCYLVNWTKLKEIRQSI